MEEKHGDYVQPFSLAQARKRHDDLTDSQARNTTGYCMNLAFEHTSSDVVKIFKHVVQMATTPNFMDCHEWDVMTTTLYNYLQLEVIRHFQLHAYVGTDMERIQIPEEFDRSLGFDPHTLLLKVPKYIIDIIKSEAPSSPDARPSKELNSQVYYKYNAMVSSERERRRYGEKNIDRPLDWLRHVTNGFINTYEAVCTYFYRMYRTFAIPQGQDLNVHLLGNKFILGRLPGNDPQVHRSRKDHHVHFISSQLSDNVYGNFSNVTGEAQSFRIRHPYQPTIDYLSRLFDDHLENAEYLKGIKPYHVKTINENIRVTINDMVNRGALTHLGQDELRTHYISHNLVNLMPEMVDDDQLRNWITTITEEGFKQHEILTAHAPNFYTELKRPSFNTAWKLFRYPVPAPLMKMIHWDTYLNSIPQRFTMQISNVNTAADVDALKDILFPEHLTPEHIIANQNKLNADHRFADHVTTPANQQVYLIRSSNRPINCEDEKDYRQAEEMICEKRAGLLPPAIRVYQSRPDILRHLRETDGEELVHAGIIRQIREADPDAEQPVPAEFGWGDLPVNRVTIGDLRSVTPYGLGDLNSFLDDRSSSTYQDYFPQRGVILRTMSSGQTLFSATGPGYSRAHDVSHVPNTRKASRVLSARIKNPSEVLGLPCVRQFAWHGSVRRTFESTLCVPAEKRISFANNKKDLSYPAESLARRTLTMQIEE